MPKLLIKTGEKQGFVHRLSDKEVLIGRSSTNTIVLPDRRVSRVHARILAQGSEYVIEDQKSVNGTLVNNATVTKQVLNIDDEITIGSTVIGYLSLSSPEEDGAVQQKSRPRVISQAGEHKGITVETMIVPEAMASLEQESDTSDVAKLQKSCQRLMTLYRFSNDLGAIVELPQLLDRTLALILEIIDADRGFIMLTDEETGKLVLQAARQKDGLLEAEEIAFSQTIADQVMQKGESILTSDAQQDSRFDQSKSVVLHGIRSTMCVPVKVKDKILGIMHVDTKGKVISFTREDLELLTAITNQAAVAIENAKLFDNLKKATKEIKQQQTQLIEAEKLSALGQLAGGVAHEINNPMTSILGYSGLAFQKLTKASPSPEELEESAKFVKIVEDEAHRCAHIVQSLLQFGRRKKEEKGPVQINDVIEASLMIARFHMKKGSVKIEKDLGADIPLTTADKSQLQQVFLNFIINAKDAMEESGGTLTIMSRLEDNRVKVRFIDTGCGIPGDKVDEIFKPLYTTKEEGKGTGLGLSISQDIIEGHKGTIELESTVGKGTTFTISLPVA